jgi:dihydroflavonol-4-reductase
MAKALITGADGLLGSNLTRELLARGYAVRAFVHPASKAPTLDGLPVEIVRGDVTEPEAVDAAVAGVDYVFHCAAITDMRAPHSLVWAVTLEGTRNIAEACLKHKVRRLLFTGSASSYQFGPQRAPGTEAGDFPTVYRGVDYMESKYAAAMLIKQYAAERGLEAVTLAPTFMLGPYDSRPSSGELIQQFIVRKLRFASPGSRNFVYVGDVAHAMANAAERGRPGETYLLAGENLSYLDFFATVARLADVPAPLGAVPAALLRTVGMAGSGYEKLTGKHALLNDKLAHFACLETCYTPARAVAELGMPQTSVETGVAASISSLRSYGHLPQGAN